MKVCPTCNQVYKDDDINFCLADGTTLLKKKTGKYAKHSLLNDVLSALIALVAVLVFLCIVTGGGTKNLIGVMGANVATFVISAFGLTAYSIPFLIGLVAWRVFQSNTLIPGVLRVAGYIFFVVSVAGLTTVFGKDGGTAGGATARVIAYFVGTVGAGILLSSFGVLSLLLITDFTLAGFLSHFDVAWDNLRIRTDEWRAIRLDDRSGEISGARDRAEKRLQKRISVESDSIPFIPTISDLPAPIPVPSEQEILEKYRQEIIKADLKADRARIGEIRERIFELKGYVLDKVKSGSSTDGGIDIDSMDGLEFEHFVAGLLNQRGYHAEVTKGSGDMGVDILATNHDKRFAVQVKRYNQPISRRAISDAVTGKNFYGCDGAMVITNNYFTKDAKTLAAASDCTLVDRDELFRWRSRDAGNIATFQTRLQVEIRNLQNLTTFSFWGKDVVFEASRELTVDYRLDFKEPSFKGFSEVNAWLDPGSLDTGYELPKPSLIQKNSGNGSFRSVVESEGFQRAYSPTTVSFGAYADGLIVTTNLAEVEHLFIAGSIDGRKPAGLQTALTSLLFKASPKDVVISISEWRSNDLSFDFREIANEGGNLSLWIDEIDKRHNVLAKRGVKDFLEYNLEAVRRKQCEINDYRDGRWIEFRTIVVILYDFADIPVERDDLLKDIVQKGGGVGVHLILATIRPTPAIIKRINWLGIPSRIVSHLPAPFDSLGILENKPQTPIGQNEMLIRLAGSSEIVSVFEPRLAYEDLNTILNYIREQGFRQAVEVEEENSGDRPGRPDPLFHDALKCVVQAKRGSTSLLQRHLRIGYGRAAAILDAMVREGYIGEMDGSSRARPVLPKAYEDLQDIDDGALGDDG